MFIKHFSFMKKLFVSMTFFCLCITAQADPAEDFFKAARMDDESAMVALALQRFDLNTADEEGNSGLMIALREGSLKVARFLLTQRVVKVELRNRHGETPLMIAALNGQIDIARVLIRRGAEVNRPGWTPLHYACSSSTATSADMVRLLLEHHAYIDAESPNRSTPLMMAARYGSPEIVGLLLEEGADPDVRNQQGLTAVDFARRAGRDDLAELVSRAVRARQAPRR